MATKSGRLRWVLYVFAGMVALLGVLLATKSRADIPLETLKQRWATGSSRFMELDGMEVHYRDEGSGAPIVLLHGTSSSLHTWDGWANVLTKTARVVRVDLPAFGLTGPSPTRDYSNDAYVDFVDRFVQKLGLERFVLAGNSLGGAISWKYALAHRDKTRALILVDSGGYPSSSRATPIAFRIAKWPIVPSLLVALDPRPLVEDGVKKAYGDPARVRPEILERYYELSLRPGNRSAFIDRMKLPRVDESAKIHEITVPTLVMWGARDNLVPVESARHFAHDIQGARLVIYDDLGHVPMEEDPERSVADVVKFLAELPGG